MNSYRYYIVNCERVLAPFYYGVSLNSPVQAQEVVDNYLGLNHYMILKGAMVKALGLSRKRAKFRAYSPEIYRKFRGSSRTSIEFKRGKLKGQGIRVYRFKAVWDPYPESHQERKRLFKKDRSFIHGQILKE